MKNIAIFASGEGTNAEQIARYFMLSDMARVQLLLTNNPKAQIMNKGLSMGIPMVVFCKKEMNSEKLEPVLDQYNINVIVLAGFLLLLPPKFINKFEGRIVNIHPSLLPKFGGKGMYGMRVHEAVKNSGEVETGITIHHVNNHYDKGEIIQQHTVKVEPSDTPGDIARKVQQLEHKYFPLALKQFLQEI